jgi:hypothetical protein
MSEYAPGTFQFAERIMDMKVEKARRETNARRLQSQAGAGRDPSPRFYGRALAWMGRRLANWGRQLQERYGSEGSRPMPQSV